MGKNLKSGKTKNKQTKKSDLTFFILVWILRTSFVFLFFCFLGLDVETKEEKS